ncbi:MAG: M20 family metallopeptidase [Candidatus Thorarchaeota archaeon]|nr:M20 family metallopeptidase [Candidatus Thorarchaeota archaeon]
MTDEKRLLNLARTLVSTNSESPPGREKEVADILRDHMESHGIACVSVGPSERPNLIFYTHEGEKGPLMFHGHMDTVPAGDLEKWKYDPFVGEIVDGKLHGRGSCDMKGPVAALTEAVIQYSEQKHATPLLLLCTSDEESGCSGAEAVADSGLLSGVTYGVCAEPTSLDVLVGEKGMLWSKVVARGKSAHGSLPKEGLNAIQLCGSAIEVLLPLDYSFEPDDLMGEMTLNIGVIQGGIKINVVPEYCEAQLDMRTVKGQTIEGLLAEMRSRIESVGLSDRVEIEYIHGKAAVRTPGDSEIVKVSLESVEAITGKKSIPTAATYGTDCSVLQPRIGILNVICGPGSIEQAHQPDEFIQIRQMNQSVEIYSRIAEHFTQE